MRGAAAVGLGLLSLRAGHERPFVDRTSGWRKLLDRVWPTIDVTRNSIEETATANLDLYMAHSLNIIAQEQRLK